VTREFKSVALTARNASLRCDIRPSHVRVVVRGPKRLVDNLDLSNGAAYVDAEGKAPGRRVVKPAVDLPTGVELLKLEPTKVRLTLRKGT
jgi:YbbR domain-containing protein